MTIRVLKKVKEDTNGQLNKIGKTMHVLNEKLNKGIGFLKKVATLEMNNSVS